MGVSTYYVDIFQQSRREKINVYILTVSRPTLQINYKNYVLRYYANIILLPGFSIFKIIIQINDVVRHF
jgi:hypothetical protein